MNGLAVLCIIIVHVVKIFSPLQAVQEALLKKFEKYEPLSDQPGNFCESGSAGSVDARVGIVSLYTRRAEVLFQAQEYKVCETL